MVEKIKFSSYDKLWTSSKSKTNLELVLEQKIRQLNLVNLDSFSKAEHVPFLQTYKGTPYFHNATAAYIKQWNLQRGTWTNDTESGRFHLHL